jgi:DNA-binding response OmpR family regulator
VGGARIVVAEDDPPIRELICEQLSREGYRVRGASDGHAALRAVREEADLLVLDLGLPGIDGLDVARTLQREGRSLPIVMLTGRVAEVDRIVGFELGADDYVCKPFSPRELAGRVKAVLRRSSVRGELPRTIRIGSLEIDERSRQANVGGNEIVLTPREYGLLAELARNAGAAMSREQLLVRVWGYDFAGDDRTVDAHVRRLRSKLEEPFGLKLIETIYGFGYRFRRA